MGGIRGWKSKIRKRKRCNIPFYRPAETTVDERLRKQLTEKESWYKNQEDNNEDDEASPSKYKRLNSLQRSAVLIRTPGRRSSRRLAKMRNKQQVKSVIFVPHTRNSGLAKDLKEKENKLQEVTGDKVKIVERAGKKLENIIAGKDPWKGKDCGRKNCFLCSTKVLTGKDLNKDCTKRNLLYEIRCLTCERRKMDRIAEICGDDMDKYQILKDKIKIPKYVGETSRSAYERGFEHLDKLATLSSNSHMLKHMISTHENEDFSEVQWGMFVLEFKRTAFERQISEAVKIQAEAEKTETDILNSKSEYNSCCLPKLVTRIGDKESEIKAWEKELEEEKKIDEKIEEKIRELRKKNNKARLRKETQITNKKQKITEDTYINIRETWGPPPPTAPTKNKCVPDKETQTASKRLRTERITNIKTTNNIIQGEEITEFEIIEVDWEKRL